MASNAACCFQDFTRRLICRRKYVLVLAVAIIFISIAGSTAVYGPPPAAAEDTGHITVLNPQSYPLVGGEWTVRLAVAGAGDLTVSAVGGTALAPYDPLHAVPHSHLPPPEAAFEPGHDLRFVRMHGADGAAVAPSYSHGGSVTFEDFAGGSFTVLVYTPGAHHLKFEFGGAVAYADNTASLVRISSAGVNNGTYVPGDAVNITATFSDAVVVETSGIVQEEGRFNALNSPHSVATVVIDQRTYALVAGASDDGIQIIDITNPASPAATASVMDGQGCNSSDPEKACFDALNGAYSVTTAVIGGVTYALVASIHDDGVQIIEITDPANPVATASVRDGQGCNSSDLERACFDTLNGAYYVTTAVIGGMPYALVSGNIDEGVQIINVTDPANPTATASVAYGEDGFEMLRDAHHIATAVIGEGTYAMVASPRGPGVQIINVTDPANPTATASVRDGQGCDPSDPEKPCFDELYTAYSVTAVEIDKMTYALVASKYDHGVQIINVTDPANPTATASVTNGEDGFDRIRDGHSITTVVVEEMTYALVASRHGNGVQIINVTDPANPVATASVTDDTDGFLKLKGAYSVTTAVIEGRTYALATSYYDDGVQIIEITDPANPVATASVADDRGGFDKLDDASSVTTALIDGKTYALVASRDQDRDFVSGGIQIIEITNPAGPVAIASVTDEEDGFRELDGAISVTTAVIDGRTYALAAGSFDDGIQIIEITNPASPAATASIADGRGGFDRLNNAHSVTTAVIDGRTYALAASVADDGVQIIEITNPAGPVATSSVTDGEDGFRELDGARSITTAVIGGTTYALVASSFDDGVQIIDITDPALPVATSSVTDGRDGFRELDGARSITTAVIGGTTYALVASSFDDGVQIINITNPAGPVATSSVTDGRDGFDELDGARSITTAVIDGSTYALVASYRDDGVQIIDITDPALPVATSSVTDGRDGFDELNGPRSVTTVVIGGTTYALVASAIDDGVQIIDISDPALPVAVYSRPHIALDAVQADRRAVYAAGSLTDTLTFEYVVQEGDSLSSLKYAGINALVVPPLNKIRDQDSGAVILPILPVPGQPNSLSANGTIVVADVLPDVPPTVASIERSDPADQATDSRTLVFAVTFSEPVTGVDLDDFVLSPDAARGPEPFTHARAVSIPIPDAGAAISDTITATDPGLAASVSVGVDIAHTFIGDLVVDLIAPDGTTANLHNRTGEHGNNIDLTYAPPDFGGTGIAGDWVLRVSDLYGDDTGTLNGWSLAIEREDASAVTGLNGSDARYFVGVLAALNGTYNLDIVQDSGIADMTGNLLGDASPTGGDQSYAVSVPVVLNVSANSLPSVDAGQDLSVMEGQTATLNGTADDTDGDPLTYSWSHHGTAAPVLWFENLTAPSTAFTAPWVDSNSTLTLTLTVSDGAGTASDSVNIAVVDTPTPPRGPHDIGRMTLGTAPGVILASWEAPDEAPANYRVSWARAGESYLTWTDLTGNAFPTLPSHAITGLEGGQTYKVKVRASYDGTAGDWSDEATVILADSSDNNLPVVDAGPPVTAPEGSPVSLEGTAIDPDGDSLTYLWSHDLAAHAVWFSNLTSPSTTFMAPRVSSNSTLTLTLSASDGAGTASDSVNIAIVATPEPPRGPYDIGRVTLSSAAPGTIHLSWEAPDEAPANYRVMWAKAGDAYLTWTDSDGNAFPTVPLHTITGLEEGAEYRMRVRASYDGTAGDWSGEVTATTAGTSVVPDIPAVSNTPATGLPVIAGTAEVGQTLRTDISGIADADGMANSTLSYQWISGDGTDNAEIAGATTSAYVLAAGDLNNAIMVRVSFTDDAGHAESLTSAATPAVAPASTVPGLSAGLSVLPNGSGTLDVSWQAPASNGGQNITGYTVQWKAASGAWTAPADVTEDTVTGTTHTITGLADGTPYTVRVIATNGVGDGAPTSEERATPQAPAPPHGPRDIGVITLNGTVPGTIHLSWEAPDEAPANYRVMWAKAGDAYLTWTDLTGNAFPTVPLHTITGLEEGAEYRLKVRASYDGTAGDWSAEVTVTVARTG